MSDISVPTEELTRYLVNRYDERFSVHPRKFEELVGGVFRDHGYEVRVTSYSNDGGIDVVVLDGARDDTIGIQVKRHRGRIGVEQVRSFAGALVASDFTRGIFVATSEFTKPAMAATRQYEAKGLSIELVDAKRFYDRLRIRRLDHPLPASDPSAPYHGLLDRMMDIPELDHVEW